MSSSKSLWLYLSHLELEPIWKLNPFAISFEVVSNDGGAGIGVLKPKLRGNSPKCV